MLYLLDMTEQSIQGMLGLPSLPAGIQTRDPDHDQSVTNGALDRSAMVPFIHIVVLF